MLGSRCSDLAQVAVQVLAATAGLQLIRGGQGRALQLSHGEVPSMALAFLVNGELLFAGGRHLASQAVQGILLTAAAWKV